MPNRRKDYKNMDKYRKTKKEQSTRYRLRTGAFLYPRRPWEEWEDELVLEHSYKDTELAVKLERSVQAIQNRRWRLNHEI